MFCSNCGSQVNDGAAFCPKCGAQLGVQVGNAPQMQPNMGNAQGASSGNVNGYNQAYNSNMGNNNYNSQSNLNSDNQFNIWAFLFGGWWMLFAGLWDAFLILFAGNFIITFVFSLLNPTLGYVVVFILWICEGIFFGRNGNYYRRLKQQHNLLFTKAFSNPETRRI